MRLNASGNQKMNKRAIFSIIFLVAVIILSLWAFIMSGNILKKTEVAEKNDSGISEEITLRELVITETREGKKFWEVYADSGRYDNGSNVAILKNITGNFYDGDKVILSLSSPTATYDNNTKEIKLQGGVEAMNDKNVYLRADEVSWKGAKNNIVASGNVKIIRENQVMTVSDKSVFNTDFSNLEISGNSNTYVFSLK